MMAHAVIQRSCKVLQAMVLSQCRLQLLDHKTNIAPWCATQVRTVLNCWNVSRSCAFCWCKSSAYSSHVPVHISDTAPNML